jgi:hypothetical protein
VCEILHPEQLEPTPGLGISGIKARLTCYAPSTEEMAAGCLPASSPLLKQEGYLSKHDISVGQSVLSVQSEATVFVDPCETLAACCPQLPPLVSEGIQCEYVALQGDQKQCLERHGYVDATCGPLLPGAPQPGEPYLCCYKTCSIFHSAGRPVQVEGQQRVAFVVRRGDW